MTIRSRRTAQRIAAAIAAVGIAATSLAITSPVQATQNVASSRVGGLDRYATAALVAQATFTAPNPNIILASGLNFPDGLAAAGLAGAANAPVLLTDPNSLPGATQNAMGALFGASATKTVHIVGGEAAVSAAVVTQVEALGYTVNRVAGANRYETAAAIATFQATLAPVGITTVAGVPLRTAIVATGENFPDALSGGAPAFRGKHPILLTRTASLPTETSGALTSLSVQRVILLGGEAAVSADVATAIGALGSGIRVDRVAGANRGETAQQLANILVSSLANGGFNFYGAASSAACLGTGVTGPNMALIVNGSTFADALAAGPHAGSCGAPILIAGNAASSTFLTANTANVGLIRAIGGTAAVPDADLTAAVTAASSATPTTVLTIHEANAVIKAEFSETISVTGDVKVNNGADLCGATATVLPAAGGSLAGGTCYLITADGMTTLWVVNGANLVEGDSVVVSGFQTPVAAGSRTAASATAVVPATPATLTGTISGANVSAGTATVTFNRPVVLTGAATDATITRASGGGAVNIGPLTFAAGGRAAQIATTATITVPAPVLAAGDIVKVLTTGATGAATGTNLQADISVVVPPAGAAPILSSAVGVLTATGGVLNTTGAIDTNIVVQAKSALPAGAVAVVLDGSNAGTNSVATTAAAVLDNTTGITTVTVKLGTDGAGALNATSSIAAAAINAGAGAVVTATASNPTSVVILGALASQNLGAGTRTLAVTATSSKPLNAVTVGSIGYDGNADGFDDAGVGAPTLSGFTGPAPADSTFVLTFELGVGTLPTNTGAAFTAGTSQLRLASGALTDSTSVNNLAQIIAITG